MQPDGGAGQRKRASRQGRRGGADPSRGRGSVSLFTRGGTAEIFFVSVDRGQGAIRSWSVSPVRRLAHEDRRIPRRSNAEWSLRSLIGREPRRGGRFSFRGQGTQTHYFLQRILCFSNRC